MTDPEKLIAGWLDVSLNEAEQAELDEWLKANDENMRRFTDAAMFEQQIQSATIAVEEQSAAARFNASVGAATPRVFSRRSFAVFAATLVVILALVLLPQHPADETFATLDQTRAVLWESGDLPTTDGSRLEQGALRLAEGLATLKFDSGAEVVLEAPATLILIDAMNCELTRGTAVSDIPESAVGFRIKTPSADVVDYGTRFAVSVHEGTGETHTQVIEGRVQVEYARSDEVVELKTGQRNTVIGETLGAATDDAEHEHQTVAVKTIDHGPGWTLLEPVKDAYTGNVNGHNSDILLLVKMDIRRSRGSRTSYIGFDLNSIDQDRIQEAELLLYFAPTGWGLASLVPDATFSVYGMVGEVPDWDESILHKVRFPGAPGNPDVVHLGSFTIPQGVQKGRFRVRTEALSEFLRKHPSSEISLKVVRDTVELDNGGLVHGFASRRHPVLPPPTLALRTDDESR